MRPLETAGHMESSMRLSPTKKASTDNANSMSAMVKLAGEIDDSAPHVRRRLRASKATERGAQGVQANLQSQVRPPGALRQIGAI